ATPDVSCCRRAGLPRQPSAQTSPRTRIDRRRASLDPPGGGRPAPSGYAPQGRLWLGSGRPDPPPRACGADSQTISQSRRWSVRVRLHLEASRGGAMPALDPETRERWRDLVVVDQDAATVGPITAFYLDRATGLPTWALVHTGWFTDTQTLVPLAHAVETNQEIRIPYPKAFIQQAPRIQAHQELSPDHEVVLSA